MPVIAILAAQTLFALPQVVDRVDSTALAPPDTLMRVAADVLPVQAGDANRRHNLLDASVEVSKLAHHASMTVSRDTVRPLDACRHTKTFGADGTPVFTGSFNCDPRASTLYTAMGWLPLDWLL
jgi:hypothetical protein